MSRRTIRVGVLGAVLAIFLSAPGWAQDPAAAQPDESATEGITVHGHWTIEVIRDETVIERREFENALTFGGAQFLSDVLSSNVTTGAWSIVLSSSQNDDACLTNGSPAACLLEESSGGLSVTSRGGDDAASLVLEGSTTAERDGGIDRVRTRVFNCDPSVAPADCGTSSGATVLTTTDISQVTVQNGDQINVSVVISFS